MSRRKSQWKRRGAQAGDVNKIIPTGAKGTGYWLMNGPIAGRTLSMPAPGSTEGKTVTLPISPRKEQLVRQWCKSS
jgi:hypothetical protein